MPRYLELEREWVSWFFLEIPTLANGLAAIPRSSCRYNPFRNYMESDYRTLPTVEPIRRVATPPLPYNPFPFEGLVDPWADDPP